MGGQEEIPAICRPASRLFVPPEKSALPDPMAEMEGRDKVVTEVESNLSAFESTIACKAIVRISPSNFSKQTNAYSLGQPRTRKESSCLTEEES